MHIWYLGQPQTLNDNCSRLAIGAGYWQLAPALEEITLAVSHDFFYGDPCVN
jgi:hypothetical protein